MRVRMRSERLALHLHDLFFGRPDRPVILTSRSAAIKVSGRSIKDNEIAVPGCWC